MDIRGIQKLSLIDYPGKISSVLFLPGCNLRCPYCHNPELINSIESLPRISEEDALKFLESRIGWIDGVVVTGGEPTLQEGLEGFIRKVRELKLAVKLDTNGTKPGVLRGLLGKGLLDFIAMDIKAPLENYGKVSQANIEHIRESIRMIIRSNVAHEFRSTVLPRLHTKADMLRMAGQVKGGQRFVLQNFNPGKTLDPGFAKERPFDRRFLEDAAKDCSSIIPTVVR